MFNLDALFEALLCVGCAVGIALGVFAIVFIFHITLSLLFDIFDKIKERRGK